MSSTYPLLFTYRDILLGDGFVAGVATMGRSLMVEEGENDFWIYGVDPGGIAAGGESQKEAASEFRSMYRTVLFDIADEARTYEEFKTAVEAFFEDKNEPFEQDWWRAVELVREEKVTSDWLDKEPAESNRGVKVVEIAIAAGADERVERPRPSDNVPDFRALAA